MADKQVNTGKIRFSAGARIPRAILICFALLCLAALMQYEAQPGWIARADDDIPVFIIDLAAIYSRAIPSVVSIEVDLIDSTASGAGFVLGKNGHIVTNAHVVEGARGIIVVFHNGSKAAAELIGFDLLEDIAVIKVDIPSVLLQPAVFADSDALAIGQEALAIGNPHGFGGSLTRGIISGLYRDLELWDGTVMRDMIQTDAALNPGNSGGPLLNLAGQVIGVNTLGRRSSNNIGFAIPSNRVKRISENMIAGRHFRPTFPPRPTLTRRFAPRIRATATPRGNRSSRAAKPSNADSPWPTETSTPVPTDTNTPLPTQDCPEFNSITTGSGISLSVIGVDSSNLSQVSILTLILDGSGQLVSCLDVDNFSIDGELVGLAKITAVQMMVDDYRTYYLVTMDVDVPEDGTRYDFKLNVQTTDKRSGSDNVTLRTPIPIPLLFLPVNIFADALREKAIVTVEILTDQDIESIEIALDGEVVSTNETYTIEPEKAEPGEHQLDITVSDVEGDVGTLSAEFEIAALPPTVSDDFDPATLAADPKVEVITIDAGGQTEITQVEFFIDDELYEVDTEAPYELNLDPFELRPGEHRLSVRASNAGGQTTTVDGVFDVDVIAPRLEIEGLPEDFVIRDTVLASVLATGQSPIMSIDTDLDVAAVVEDNRMEFTLDPADFPPGRNMIAIRAVDAAGAEIVQTLEFEVVHMSELTMTATTSL